MFNIIPIIIANHYKPMFKILLSLILCFMNTNILADFQKNNAEFISLLQNKTITIVAPASSVDDLSMTALKNIQSHTLDLKIKFPVGCFEGSRLPFHASSDENRFKCLKNALFDKTDHVVWAIRGGYGSAKLIDKLMTLKKPDKEKFFIGFSDITALHLFLTQHWGWKTIHGSVFTELLQDNKQRTNFTKIAAIISGTVKQAIISDLLPLNEQANKITEIRGALTGGNLTIIQTSIGTKWQIQTIDKILFLEDHNIKPYQLDRTLYHLRQAGLLSNVRAILLGAYGSDDEDIMRVLKDFASVLNIPVFKTNRIGHGAINDPIIYNTESKIIRSRNKFDLIMRV